MPTESYDLLMNASNLIYGAQQTTTAINKIKAEFAELEKTSAKYNAQGKITKLTFDGIGSSGEGLSRTLEKVRGKWLLVGSSANTAALEMQRAKAAAQALESAAQSKRNIQANTGVASIAGSTKLGDGSSGEIFNYNRAIAGLKGFMQQNDVSARLMQKIWTDVSNNAFKPYTGRLGELQAKLFSVRKAVEDVGKEQQRLNDRSRGFLLSWESITRFFEARVLYNSISQITGAIQQGVVAAAELQQWVGRIQTLTPNVTGDFQAWESSVQRVSKQFGTDAIDTAKAYYSALSNQIGDSIGQIESFTKTTAEFARVTGSSAEQANNLFSSAINAFKLNAADATIIAGKFFKAIDLGRITAAGLSGSFGRVAVAANTIGVSLEETLAALSTLSRQGVTDADAMTQVLNVFNKLLSPTEKLKKLFDEWGVESGQAAIEMFGFQGVLEKLNDEAAKRGGLSLLLDDFSDIRAKRGIAGLVGDLQNFKRDLDKITDSHEDYNRAREKTLTNGFKLNKQINEMKVAFIEFGDKAVNVIVPVLESIGGLTTILKTVTVAMAGIAGPLVVAGISLLVAKIGTLIKAFSALRFAAIASGVGAVAAIVGTAAGIFLTMESKAEAARRVYGETLDAMNKKNEATFKELDAQSKKTALAIDRAFAPTLAKIAETRAQLKVAGDALDAIMVGYKKRLDNIAQADYNAISEKLQGLGDDLRKIEDFNKFLSENIIKTVRDRTKQAFSDSIEDLPAYAQAKAFVKNAGEILAEANKALIENDAEKAKTLIGEVDDRARAAVAAAKQGASELAAKQKELNGLKAEYLDGDAEQLELQKRANSLAAQATARSKAGSKRGITSLDTEIADVKAAQNASKYNEAVNKQIERRTRIRELEKEINALEVDQRGFNIKKELVKLDDAKLKILKEQQVIEKQMAEDNKKKEADLKKSRETLVTAYEEINKIFISSDEKNPFFGKDIKTKEEGIAKLDKAIQNLYDSRAAAGLSLSENLQLMQFTAAAKAQVVLELEKKKASTSDAELRAQKQNLQDLNTKKLDEQKAATLRYAEAVAKLNSVLNQEIPKSRVFTDGVFGAAVASDTVQDSVEKLRSRIVEIAKAVGTGKSEASEFGNEIKTLQSSLNTAFPDKLSQGSLDIKDRLLDIVLLLRAALKESSAVDVAEQQLADLNATIKKVDSSLTGVDNQSTKTFQNMLNDARAAAEAWDAVSQSAAAAITNANSAAANAPTDMMTKAGGGYIHLAGGGRPYGSDKIPAMLSPGEFVVNAGASRKFYSQLIAMNSGARNFSGGGNVTSNVGDINISLQPSGNVSHDVVKLGKMLKREIRRGTVSF